MYLFPKNKITPPGEKLEFDSFSVFCFRGGESKQIAGVAMRVQTTRNCAAQSTVYQQYQNDFDALIKF